MEVVFDMAPRFLEIGGCEEIPLNFSLGVWENIENTRSLNLSPPKIASVRQPNEI